ncbi:MAG: ABC transporter permease [Melioribacteraceae bacterium]|nr:ABC transporter permease [Melioribacteraceae bacterium]MCF8394376.1 ABC transporter permease [Melioribacteraceae bacterium]MCF8420086.1 ABC transporter permease [Melioribacteraceae bacterium]
MKKSDIFKIGLVELRANKLRTFLTMLGIVFGVGAVIAMLSIGEGARQETLEQIELLGTNNIIIKSKKAVQQGGNSNASFSPGLNIKDASSIMELNPHVESVIPQRDLKMRVNYKSMIIETKIVGTSKDYPFVYNSTISDGEFFDKFHEEQFANVCVIGPGIKEEMFRFEDPVGKEIKIADQWFKIIGITASKNVTSAGIEKIGVRDFNRDIYIPFSTMSYKFEKIEGEDNTFFGGGMVFIMGSDENANVVDRSSVDQLSVKIKEGKSIEEAAFLLNKILERRHYGVEDYEVIIPEELLEQKQRTQKIFNIVMGAIAGISLLVGGIGIMNIMLANILERTKEIGIRRAMGATKSVVLSQFMFESITISVVGGVLGIIIGFILTSVITTYAEWRTIITPFSVMLAFFVSVIVGLIFGIYPAKKAAEKDPIEALRYE